MPASVITDLSNMLKRWMPWIM